MILGILVLICHETIDSLLYPSKSGECNGFWILLAARIISKSMPGYLNGT
ncbi:hypothetical protein BN871_CZ_00380 [Paenibacillus sp. P22]|nr:hypothetical protein BN871_CZ_00380 [Paenibacillus sp. P22]